MVVRASLFFFFLKVKVQFTGEPAVVDQNDSEDEEQSLPDDSSKTTLPCPPEDHQWIDFDSACIRKPLTNGVEFYFFSKK